LHLPQYLEEDGILKLWKSKKDKEEEARQAALDSERQKLRQFQMESASILGDAIAELEATKSVLTAQAELEMPEIVLEYPIADYVVALDRYGKVLSVVDIDDVHAEVPLDEKVTTIQGLLSGGLLKEGTLLRTPLKDSNIMSYGGQGLFVNAVWHGEVTNVEEDYTKGSWDSALQFFDGKFPDEWSETETLTLYNSIRASFGKDVVEVEGLAPEIRSKAEAQMVDRGTLLMEIDGLMRQLRSEGFSTTKLFEIKAMSTRDARKNLDKFTSDLKFARILEARFYKLDAVNFPDESRSIFQKLSSIHNLTEAAMEIEALEKEVAEWEAYEMEQGITADGFDVTVEQQEGYQDIMDGIKNIELSGYDSKFIYRMLYTGDMDVARQALMAALSNIERLRQVEDKLLKLWAEGYEERFMSIQNKLTNPAMAATAEKELEALEATIRADTERERIFTLLRHRLDAWSNEGFNVQELQHVLTKDPDTIIDTFKKFSNKLSFLVKLEDDLNELEAKAAGMDTLKDDIAKIRTMLMDPSRTSEVMDALRTLRYLISMRGDEDAIREVIKTKVARWWEKGYDVAVLQKHMDQPIEVLEDIVGEFEGFVKVMEGIEEELDTIYLDGFEKEEEEIKTLLHDIKNVMQAKKKLKELKAKVIERIRSEDDARACSTDTVCAPVTSTSLLATIILRIAHRLPVALWGKDPGELAEDLLQAEHGKTKDGEIIVKVGRRWYHGDPRKENKFLTSYTVEHDEK
jgi:hypothetical protein